MKCQKCGECCIRFNFTVPLTKEELKELVQAHYGDKAEELRVFLDHKCVQLNDDNTCKIYETRPKICKEFWCEKAQNAA